jgi:hypothetical protein
MICIARRRVMHRLLVAVADCATRRSSVSLGMNTVAEIAMPGRTLSRRDIRNAIGLRGLVRPMNVNGDAYDRCLCDASSGVQLSHVLLVNKLWCCQLHTSFHSIV